MGGSGRGIAAGIVLALVLFAAIALRGERLGPDDPVRALVAADRSPASPPPASARPATETETGTGPAAAAPGPSSGTARAPRSSPAADGAPAPAPRADPSGAARPVDLSGAARPVAPSGAARPVDFSGAARPVAPSSAALPADPSSAAPPADSAAPIPASRPRSAAASGSVEDAAPSPQGGASIPGGPGAAPIDAAEAAPRGGARDPASGPREPMPGAATGAGDRAAPTPARPADAEVPPPPGEDILAAAPGADPGRPSAPRDPPAAAASAGPAIDLVRIDRDGRAQIAGRASRGAELVLRSGGVEIARATAGPRGAFAAMAALGPSERPRAIELSEAGRPGTRTIIVQPPARPAAAPSPEPPRVVGPPPDAARDPAAPPPAPPPVPSLAIAPPAAAAPPKVVVAGADGVRTVQAPPLTRGVEIDTIAYGADGGVRLEGRAPPGRAEGVRVYLDGAPVLEAPMAPGGAWSAALEGLAAGDYTLRVDSLAADGGVLARVQTPFRRETPALVAGAGAAVVTVQPGSTLWAIAEDRYGSGLSYVRVFEANRGRIRDPDLIYPGQIFDIPAAD